MIRDLLFRFKGYIIAFLIGVSMATGTLTCVRRINLETIQKLKDQSLVDRGEAQAARKEAQGYKEAAQELRTALNASVVNSKKLEKELAKIKIPEAPGPAPQYVADVVKDLQAWGLNPLVGASNTVGRSAFGIRKDETQILWQWGAQAQRVPAMEFKIQKYGEVVTSITNDRDLAIKLAEMKTLEAAKWELSADKSVKESDNLRLGLEKMQKALDRQRRMKWVYAGTAAVAAAVATKKLSQ